MRYYLAVFPSCSHRDFSLRGAGCTIIWLAVLAKDRNALFTSYRFAPPTCSVVLCNAKSKARHGATSKALAVTGPDAELP